MVADQLAHCCTIFLKSSGYRDIDDRHRNPNINTREIIWLGNQLGDIMMLVVVLMVHAVDRDGAVSFSELKIMLMIMIVINGHIGDHGGA